MFGVITLMFWVITLMFLVITLMVRVITLMFWVITLMFRVIALMFQAIFLMFWVITLLFGILVDDDVDHLDNPTPLPPSSPSRTGKKHGVKPRILTWMTRDAPLHPAYPKVCKHVLA